MPTSAYIHIPFCRQKCFYCSFVSFACPELIPRYLDALEKEIKLNYQNENLKTIYIGGGTPSILEPKQIDVYKRQVTGIGKRFFAKFIVLLIKLFKRSFRHINFASNLDIDIFKKP